MFLAMAAASIWFLLQCARLAPMTSSPVETRILAYAFFVSFVTYFVTSLGTQRFYCESFWWVFALPLCLYRVVLREIAEQREDPQLLAEASMAIECMSTRQETHAAY